MRARSTYYPSLVLHLTTISPVASLAPLLRPHLGLPKYSGEPHPDITIVSPLEEKTSISIDQVHRLTATASFHPVFAPHHSVIFSPADCLTIPAQQALLKFLEEPPRYVQCLLLTARPSALLPTVLSRCQIHTIVTSTEDILTSPPEFPTSIAQALKESDTYAKREDALRYLQTILRTPPTHSDQASTYLQYNAALLALSRLKKNINPKLVLDHFFFAILDRK